MAGVAATRRGDKRIAQQSEYRYSEHEVAVAKRQIMRENQLLAKQVEQQGQELETLRAQVAELEALRTNYATLSSALAKAEENHTSFVRFHRELAEAYATRIKAHEKLSEIVRLALSPEEYHRYREIVETHGE